MVFRRSEIRKKLTAFTPVRDERGTLLGFLSNMTLLGALVIGEKPLEENKQVTMVIEFPEDLPGHVTPHMSIKARVARCVADKESPHSYNIGFEFVGIESEQSKLLQALLDRYQFTDQI
jgi:hypothetical protein